MKKLLRRLLLKLGIKTYAPPKQRFRFSEISDDLYKSTAAYFSEELPLPYASRAGHYKLQTVPKTIHFIWIGSAIPEQYLGNVKKFAAVNPDYSIVLWVDRQCNRIKGAEICHVDVETLANKEIYKRANNIGIKADLLRMEIVLNHGGIYSDIDAVALRPFDELFKHPFLAHEPHIWKDIGSGIFGFPRNDPFLAGCVYDLSTHVSWIVSKKPELLTPTPSNESCFCSGVYIMSQLFRWSNLSELNFISQDYLVTDTGLGFCRQTNDGTWIKSLDSVETLWLPGGCRV